MSLFRLPGRSHALTRAQRDGVRKRFESLARTAANYMAVAKELHVSRSTIERCVRGR